jgi:hypothetical protein
MGIYSDNANSPGTLIEQTDPYTPAVSGWNEVPITALNLTNGQKYWIVFGSNDNYPYESDSAYGFTFAFAAWTYSTAFPLNPAGWYVASGMSPLMYATGCK